MRHFITFDDVSVAELKRILELAQTIKADYQAGKQQKYFVGKSLALIFEKQSLRTRVSFEAGMTHLGGASMFLGDDVGFGKRESTADFSRVLSSMVDAIAFRAKKHESVVELAKYSSCPVINALTDKAHPCQILADLLTIQERLGALQNLKLAWVGDANNVAASLVRGCVKLGIEVVLGTPKKHQFDAETVRQMTAFDPNYQLTQTTDPFEAVKGAHAVFTDVWVSMGQEAEEAERKRDFADYQVNAKLLAAADKNCIFLHCLPARRGLEVTDEVMDSPQSAIVQEAENRLHAQKGLLVWLLNEAEKVKS
ncbi:MAG: ornithine carbamoyltransferase [Planctomycetaceae bacterium]|jgi:ornithine carbamoyltransferase|nr:ornithine carbamoyltransferase [Planctomycetaceae bacterium]